MPVLTKRQLRLALLLIYLLSISVSFTFCWIKFDALGYHTRDYPFYLQFAAKVFDPALSNEFTINPYGYNFLGFDGTEGTAGLFHTLHLEPIKFFYGFLYGLTGSPLPIFLLFGLIYFAPTFYFGWHLCADAVCDDAVCDDAVCDDAESARVAHNPALSNPTEEASAKAGSTVGLDAIFALLFSLLLLLFPSSILAVADDLRPYTLLAPLLTLALLAVQFDAPRWQALFFFSTMLWCREEGLVLGLFVIGYALLRAENQANAKRTLGQYGTIWLLWSGCTLVYYVWTGYALNPFLTPLAALVTEIGYGLALGIWIGLILGFYAFWRLWSLIGADALHWLSRQYWLQVSFFGLILIPLFRQVSVSKGRKFDRMVFGDALFSIFKDFMLFPKFTLIFMVVMLLIGLIWIAASRKAVPRKGLRRSICGGLLVLVLTCVYLQTVPWMKTPMVWLARYQQQRTDTQIIWALREETLRYETAILSDLDTYQAYADYEKILVYERLPWTIEPSEQRHFPANVERTAAFLKDRIEYIVASKNDDNAAAIAELIQKAGVDAEISIENDRYQVIKITAR